MKIGPLPQYTPSEYNPLHEGMLLEIAWVIKAVLCENGSP